VQGIYVSRAQASSNAVSGRGQFFIILKSHLHRNKHLPQAIEMQPFLQNPPVFVLAGTVIKF
jgi:hypothetical protein